VAYDAVAGVLLVAAPEGVPLQRLVEHRVEAGFPMTPATVLDVGVALAEALTYAHERGKPHGHLSPASVWLAHDGSLVVWGFGAGPDAPPPPRWTSPERARGRRASGDADQWALGAILAGLATSRVPWRSDDPLTEARVGDASPLHGPVLDQWRALGRVLEKMLEPESRARYPSLHPVRQALSALRQRVPGAGKLAELGARLDALYGGTAVEPTFEVPTAVSEEEPPHGASDPSVAPNPGMQQMPFGLESLPEPDTSPTSIPSDDQGPPSVIDEPVERGEPSLGFPEPPPEATLGLESAAADEEGPPPEPDAIDVVDAEPYAPDEEPPSLPGIAVEPMDLSVPGEEDAWLATDSHPAMPPPSLDLPEVGEPLDDDDAPVSVSEPTLSPELEVEPAVAERVVPVPVDDRAWFERLDVRPIAPWVVGALVLMLVVYAGWLAW
jgi:serine/threonine protein kinase